MECKELNEYVFDPNPKTAMNLAYWYIQHDKNYSASIIYFLKAAEYDSSTQEIQYECLLMISYLYMMLGRRWKGAVQYSYFAKALFPEKPDSYLMICEILSDYLIYYNILEMDDWVKIYLNSKMGLYYANKEDSNTSLYYKGKEHLQMYYCISLLRINKHDELKQILKTINIHELDDYLKNIYIYIYDELGIDVPINYDYIKQLL